MKKSAEQSIIDFLRANPSRFAAAELQRMSFANKNGTLANPKAISRRLQENAEEGGMLEVTYDEHNNAWYQIKQGFEKPKKLVIDESKPPVWDEEQRRWKPQFALV